MIAVFVGWAFAGEPLTLRTLLATAVIVTAVVTITTFRAKEAGVTSKEALLPAEECPALPDEAFPQIRKSD